MVYFACALLTWGVGAYFSSQKYSKTVYYFLLYFAIVLFWGISYINAPDTDGYIEKFNFQIQPLGGAIDDQFEIGYSLLAMVFKSIGNYWLFQLSVFAVEVLLIIKGFRHFWDDKLLLMIVPLLFFVFPMNLAAFRQGIATSLFIYGMQYINAPKLKTSLLFFVFVLLAFLFHQSSIILILFYFVRFFKKIVTKDWILVAVLLIGNLIWLSGISIVSSFDFLMPLFEGDTLEMGWKYASLIEGATETGTYGFAKVLEMNVAVILFMVFCKKDKEYELLCANMMIYVLCGLVIGGLLAHRLNYYWALLYYACLINGFISFFRKCRMGSTFGYLFLVVYMLYFFIFRCGYIHEQYHLLFNY